MKKVTAKSKLMTNLVSRCSERLPNMLNSTASETWWKPNMKVNYLWARGMSSIEEQGDLFWTLTHQVPPNGTLTTSGVHKCGYLVKCWDQEREDPSLTSLLPMMISTLTLSQNRTFLQDHDCERYWTILQKIQCTTTKKHSIVWRLFMSSTLEASVFMGKIIIPRTQIRKKKWSQGHWDGVALLMMIKVRDSGHLVFRSTSPLSRGVLKSK